MAKGGPPPQEKAGRPAPARKRSVVVANQIAEGKRILPSEDYPLAQDVTPLEVMLLAMRRAWDIGGSLMAAPYAKEAAPFLHAKISALELKNPTAPSDDGKSPGKPQPLLVRFVKPK